MTTGQWVLLMIILTYYLPDHLWKKLDFEIDILPWCSWIRASWYNYENNPQAALYRLIYYSNSALHVLLDVFAHHQEHLTVFTVSDSVAAACWCPEWVETELCRLWGVYTRSSFNSSMTPAGSNLGEYYQML